MKLRKARGKESLIRGTSGASAVEFALLLPIFLIILFGIIQFGAVLFLHNNMANAAREATRRMSVAEMNATQAETYAQSYLAGWGLTFTVVATEATVPNGDVSVQISVPAGDAVLINFLPVAWTGNLVATATMRSEG